MIIGTVISLGLTEFHLLLRALDALPCVLIPAGLHFISEIPVRFNLQMITWNPENPAHTYLLA